MQHGLSAIFIKRLQSLLFVVFASACLALSAGTASADTDGGHDGHKDRPGSLGLPVTGTFAPSVTAGPLSSLGSGTFAGTFNVQRFARQNLQVVAIGTLVGTFTGSQVRTVVKSDVALPLTLTAQAVGTGTVTLPLGPASVDAGGVVINVNATSVTILDPPLLTTLLNDLATLITDLVTGVANITTTTINGLVSLLNQILGLLV